MLSAEWVDAAEEDFAPPDPADFVQQAPVDFIPRPVVFVPRPVVFVPHLVDSVPHLVDSVPLLAVSAPLLVDLDQAAPAFAHLRRRPGAMACQHLLRLVTPSHGGLLCQYVAVSTMGFATSITTVCSSTIVLDFLADRRSSSEVVLVSEPVRFLDGPSLVRPSMDLPIIRITPATIMATGTRLRRNRLS